MLSFSLIDGECFILVSVLKRKRNEDLDTQKNSDDPSDSQWLFRDYQKQFMTIASLYCVGNLADRTYESSIVIV